MKNLKVTLNLITIAVILTFIFTSTASGASLLVESEGYSDLFGTRTAFREGDIVTIVFNERTVADQSAKGTLQNTYKTGANQGVGLLENFLGLGMSGGENVNVGVSTNQTHSLNARITARVIEVLPNGNMRIEGTKSLEVNHETQKLVVNGMIRPIDISHNNTIESTRIADLSASVNGLPVERSVHRRRGGILRWIWGLLF
jgi:flagellar L-ring protein FlgH